MQPIFHDPTQPDPDGLFSRERLAGYDPAVLAKAAIAVVGAGALGNNCILALALSGVGEIRIIDGDTVDISNLSRSPLFRRRPQGSAAPPKAREVASTALSLSYAERPRMRFANAWVERLGLGAFEDACAIVSAVDSFEVRAWLADAARLLSIPLIEAGFYEGHGHISAFRNAGAEEPCWRCLHPGAAGGFSCATLARQVVAAGGSPATQPLAQVFGGLVAEHAILAAHGRFPLANKRLHLDIRTGRSHLVELSADPDCPGIHRLAGTIRRLAARHDGPLAKAFEELGPDAILYLPSPFVVSAPCAACGSAVPVGKPASEAKGPFACPDGCPEEPAPAGIHLVHSLSARDRLAGARCKKLGLNAGAVFEAQAGGEAFFCALAGGPDELFTTLARGERDLVQAPRMERQEDTHDAHGPEAHADGADTIDDTNTAGTGESRDGTHHDQGADAPVSEDP
jgi:adenylyltransferase/sulfurtransferase